MFQPSLDIGSAVTEVAPDPDRWRPRSLVPPAVERRERNLQEIRNLVGCHHLLQSIDHRCKFVRSIDYYPNLSV